MASQAPLRVVSPPTTLSKSYLPSNYAPSSPPTTIAMTEASQHNAMRIARATDLGSTAKGIMIGIFSVLGAAGVCLIIVSIVYYFRYTQQGRIFLDRLSRPGEYDDEQQFAKEEAEALEDMDDIQRTEYMRAKGTPQETGPSSHNIATAGSARANRSQLSYRQIRPNRFRPTSPYRSSWQYKRRGCPHGNSNLSLRLQIALSKVGLRLNSSTPNAASRAIYRYRSRTRSTTGKQKCMRSPRTQA